MALKILISNDDGVHADGLHALARELRKLGRVWVVAPLEEKSTTGHSLTLHKPLRIHERKEFGKRVYGVTGSPADCIYLGIREILGVTPDIVVSGINRGANLGQDIYYSGTVSAAREACMLGIPSLAVSLHIDFKRHHVVKHPHYATGARYAARVVKWIAENGLPHHTLLNLNVPDLAYAKVKGLRMAEQGFRHYSGSVLRRVDHRGRYYYWVGGEYKGFRRDEGSDCLTVSEKYAALTPIKLDATDRALLKGLSADRSLLK